MYGKLSLFLEIPMLVFMVVWILGSRQVSPAHSLLLLFFTLLSEAKHSNLAFLFSKKFFFSDCLFQTTSCKPLRNTYFVDTGLKKKKKLRTTELMKTCFLYNCVVSIGLLTNRISGLPLWSLIYFFFFIFSYPSLSSLLLPLLQ